MSHGWATEAAHGGIGWNWLQWSLPQATPIGELGRAIRCLQALRRLLQQKPFKTLNAPSTGASETLNRCLPTRYKSPSYLLALIRRDLEKPQEN